MGTVANQMLMVALGWQMYDLTGSAWDLGLVGLYQFVPALLLVLVAGHVNDRYDRRLVLASCLVAQMVGRCDPADGHARALDRPRPDPRTLAAARDGRAFQMPAQQALTPLLVPPSVLPRAFAFAAAGHAGGDHHRPGTRRLHLRGGRRGRLRVLRRALRGRVRPDRRRALRAREPAARAHHALDGLRGRALHLAPPGRARGDLAGSLRGAARRRHGPAADLREGHPVRRARGAWACCAPRRPRAP